MMSTTVQSNIRDLLVQARRALDEAAAYDRPAQRYATAHLAALRTTSAVLAARAGPGRSRRGGPRDAWSLLVEVAPELGEWAIFFAAGAGKRAAAEAGIRGAVTSREADDLIRDVATFIRVVAAMLSTGRRTADESVDGRARQQTLPGVLPDALAG
jgi:SAV_6107-like HEPN